MRNPTASLRRTSVAINMTPMIDVTFLLIIFFLVSSHLSKQENNVKLELPTAANAIDAQLAAATHVVTINVLEDGSIQIGGNAVANAELAPLLAGRQSQIEQSLQARIRCGTLTAYQHISKVLRACVDANVTDVVFAVYDTQDAAGQ